MCIFPKLQSVMLPFTYVCFWICCTSIKALFFLFTKFHNTKLRTVPRGTVRKVRLVRIFIKHVPTYRTRTLAIITYRTSVPYYLPKNGAYRTVLAYRTVPYCHPCSRVLWRLVSPLTCSWTQMACGLPGDHVSFRSRRFGEGGRLNIFSCCSAGKSG